jgi:uncharacterized protein (DUF58 family)
MLIRPARRLLAWLLVPLLALISIGSAKALGWLDETTMDAVAWSALVLLLLAALGDALWLARLPSPLATRRLPASLALARWAEVELTLQPAGRRPLQVSVFDHVPPGLQFEGLPRALTLQPEQSTRVNYRICPQRRGPQPFSHCEVELLSPLGLWRQARALPLADQPRVYPDFAGLQGDRLSAVDSWLNQLGVRQQPRRGQGMEFNQLRELRDGDSQRQIDWKATARHSRPIVREYQDERDQQIIFLLDCGRRMRSQDDSLSHFDHALNACLLLSHVALRQGDAVGLLTFASEPPRFVAPQKGQRQLNVLLDAVHDLETSRHQADFSEAARQLLQRQRRRALVVLVSNLGDEDDEQLLSGVKQIGRYHRVLVASLREGVLDQIREAPLHTWQQALDYCGAVDYLQTRDTLNDSLKAHGVALMDARPAELGAGLISRYLSWKKAGLL